MHKPEIEAIDVKCDETTITRRFRVVSLIRSDVCMHKSYAVCWDKAQSLF